VVYGLRLGIEFKGGQKLEVRGGISQDEVRSQTGSLGLKDVSVITSGANTVIRYRDDAKPKVQQSNHQVLSKDLAAKGHPEISFETVGPSVSRDITRNAIISVALASLAIVLYIAFAFRNIPPPMTSWQFGVVAIVAMLHDALLLVGLFSILGVIAGVEIDSLFITAVLTVIGFSVHDTIVVFDRIRENLRRERGTFEAIVNTSILETLARSLNTSLTVLLALLALYLLGGESIKLFILALLVGIASGTYSSILTASPLLVTWYNWQQKRSGGAKSESSK
ncbi:MAG TPA: protein translocase subunit SecF, partial [Candidatus Polarisedimenticolaceae bacterium]|nr:protein translocase subunit SecF [Candidatus Polarisedimenticolaceae bacterium]